MKILTGDNVVTARVIANELNLLENEYKVIEAKELENSIFKNIASNKLMLLVFE